MFWGESYYFQLSELILTNHQRRHCRFRRFTRNGKILGLQNMYPITQFPSTRRRRPMPCHQPSKPHRRPSDSTRLTPSSGRKHTLHLRRRPKNNSIYLHQILVHVDPLPQPLGPILLSQNALARRSRSSNVAAIRSPPRISQTTVPAKYRPGIGFWRPRHERRSDAGCYIG